MKTPIKCCSCGRYIEIDESEDKEKVKCPVCNKNVIVADCKQLMKDDWG
jgi:predicted RNA-binding Zn-ribbon protein involved in translation (DUF1610 family)